MQFKLKASQELSFLISPLNNAVENMMKLEGKNYIRYQSMNSDISMIQSMITSLRITHDIGEESSDLSDISFSDYL